MRKLTKQEKAILYIARCIECGEWQGIEQKTLNLLELQVVNKNENTKTTKKNK